MINDATMMALSYPFESGMIPMPGPGRWAVLHADLPLPSFLPPASDIDTPWKQIADIAIRSGHTLLPGTDALDTDYDGILIRLPHQRDCALGLLAQAWNALKPGGLMIAAATNDAGGKRLEKDLSPYLPALQDASKHKCRIVWAQKDSAMLPQSWIEQAGWQQQPATHLWTRPGLFSWDRVDAGTSLLLRHLPDGLTGSVADFGCGIGIIAHHLLTRNPAIRHLSAIDADRRAIEAATRNLTALGSAEKTILWADLTQTIALPRQDTIVMNPPFHNGKAESIALGQACILQARSCLKPGGSLWMVANTHLPYEVMIAERFSSQTLITRENGFKIIHATA